MASVWPKKNRWHLGWMDPATGRQKSRSLGPKVRTRAEAEVYKRQAERELESGGLRLPGVALLGDVIDDFCAAKRAMREEATAKTYEKHAKHFRRLLPIGARIDLVTPAQLRAYMATRREEASAVTANKERTTLAVLWRWARLEKLTRENPVEAVPAFEVEKSEPEPCPESVYLDCVATARREARDRRAHPREDERYWRTLFADALETLWWTGIRMGELCRIDTSLEGLDLEAGWFLRRATPRKGGNRPLPIPREVSAIFRRRAALVKDGGPLFGTADGGSAYGALYLARRRWLAEHRGPDGKPLHAAAKFHRLRHAHEDRARAAGIDPVLRSKAKGHKSVTMTGHYSHPDLAELRGAQEQLARSDRRRAAAARKKAPKKRSRRRPAK